MVVGALTRLFVSLFYVVKLTSYCANVPLGDKGSRGGEACRMDCLFRRRKVGICHFFSVKGCMCFAAQKSMADVGGSSAKRQAVAVCGSDVQGG